MNCFNHQKFISMDDSCDYSQPSIKHSKTFDLGSDSDLTDEELPMTDNEVVFPPESYMSPPPMPYFRAAPPSNIFNNIPERTEPFYHDTTGAPCLPDYLSDEDEMDLECFDSITRGSILILPRYSLWKPDESFVSLESAPAFPSLYSGSEEDEEEERDEDDDKDSNCSTVPSLPCMQSLRRERTLRRAMVGKKALLQRATSDDQVPSVTLNLEGAKASTFVAYAA